MSRLTDVSNNKQKRPTLDAALLGHYNFTQSRWAQIRGGDPMSAPKIPPEFDELSTSEKIEDVQLWDRIANEVDSAEPTDEHREELDRRLTAHRENPDDVTLWPEVRRRLRGGE
jgi:putative addiction module component (TIGR02574 family)